LRLQICTPIQKSWYITSRNEHSASTPPDKGPGLSITSSLPFYIGAVNLRFSSRLILRFLFSFPLHYEASSSLNLLLPPPFPGHAGNLILCSSCHDDYDSKDTAWFMLPTNLKFLIEYEENDYNERIAAARQGIRRPRSMPEVLFFFLFFLFNCLNFHRTNV
jgi:hypothetical protein